MLKRVFLAVTTATVLAVICAGQTADPKRESPVPSAPAEPSYKLRALAQPDVFLTPKASAMGQQWLRVKLYPGFNPQPQKHASPVSLNLAIRPIELPIILCSTFPENPILVMKGSAIVVETRGLAGLRHVDETTAPTAGK